MATYESISSKHADHIRKGRDGSLFYAAHSADGIDDLTGSDSSLVALPTGWFDFGYMSDEGIRLARETETSDVTSWGRVEPTRRDITSSITTLQATLQEVKRDTAALFAGVARDAVTMDATSGEVQITYPSIPTAQNYRLLALTVDVTPDGDRFYLATYLPNVQVTNFGEQAFAKSDDPIQYDLTFTAFYDDDFGSARRDYLGGPGAKALKTSMGF